MLKYKKQNLNLIFKKYPKIIFVYLFGSVAKNKTGILSDLDLAVYFDEKINKEERSKLSYKIQDELEIKLKLPDKVDVISLNDAQPFLEREIIYEGQFIYSKNEAKRTHYESRAISRWLDWKWYDDQFDKAIIKHFGKTIKPFSYAK